jgi:hypothetical protein
MESEFIGSTNQTAEDGRSTRGARQSLCKRMFIFQTEIKRNKFSFCTMTPLADTVEYTNNSCVKKKKR